VADSAVRNYDARHLSSRKDYQLQMTNWFEIQIDGISESITMLQNSMTLPDRSTPVVDIPFGNSHAKVAGQAEYADGTLEVNDAILVDTEKEIEAWQNQVYDPNTGKMGWVNQYKRDMILSQRGPDGTYIRQWKYEGVWPSAVNYGEMSNDSSDRKRISMTLSYDRAYRLDVQNVT
jgi:hypothetical protein